MKRIVMFAPYGAWPVHHQIEAILGSALRLRGADVLVIRCDGIFQDCSLTGNPSDRNYCKHCIATGNQLFSPFKLKSMALSKLITAEDLEDCRQWTLNLSESDLEETRFEGNDLSTWISPGIHSYFRASHLDHSSPEVLHKYRCFLFNAAILCRAFRNLIERFPPDHATCFHSMLPHYRVFLELARKHGIPFIIHDRSFVDDSFQFIANENIHEHAGRVTAWQVWKDVPLSLEECREIHNYFADREQGVNINFTSFYRWGTSGDDIRHQLRIPGDARIVAFFSSSDWEIGIQRWDVASAYSSEIEAIRKAVEICARDNTYLVIRHHPNIVARAHTDSSFMSEIFNLNHELPENVRVIMPTDKITSYAVLWHADAVITHGTTTGIESVARGLGSCSGYNNIYTALDIGVDNIAEPNAYGPALERALLKTATFDVDDLRCLYRGAHFFFLKRSFKFKSFGIINNYEPDIRINCIDDLLEGHDPNLDYICNHILKGSSLYPVPGETEQARSSETETLFLEEVLSQIRHKRLKAKLDGLASRPAEPLVSVVRIREDGIRNQKETFFYKTLKRSRHKNRHESQGIALPYYFSAADFLKELDIATQTAKGEYLYFATENTYLDESLLSSAVDCLVAPENKHIDGIITGTWICNGAGKLTGELYTDRQDTTDYDASIKILPALKNPAQLLSLLVFRQTSFEKLIKMLDPVPATLPELSRAIFSLTIAETAPLNMTLSHQPRVTIHVEPNAEELADLGIQALRTGDARTAEQRLDRARDLGAQMPDLGYFRALAKFRLGKTAEARSIAEAQLAAGGESPPLAAVLNEIVTKLPDPLPYEAVEPAIDDVEGYLSPGQEKFLFDKVRSLPDGAVILEIGSCYGRSTVAMAYACLGTNKRLIAMDTFKGNTDGGTISLGNTFMDVWQRNVSRYGLDRYVTAMPGYSHEQLAAWDDGPKVDMAFIDASHLYPDVIKEFELVYPLVKDGGWIAFHDVEPGWPGSWRAWVESGQSLLTDHQYCANLAAGRKQPGMSFILPDQQGFSYCLHWARHLAAMLPQLSEAMLVGMGERDLPEGDVMSVIAAETTIAGMPDFAANTVRSMLLKDAAGDPHLLFWNALTLLRGGDRIAARANLLMAAERAQGQLAERIKSYLNGLNDVAEPSSAALSPSKQAASAITHGEDLFSQGDTRGALKAFRQAITLDPTNAEAHANLGAAAWQLGDQAAAIASFMTALGLNPSHRDTVLNLGEAYTALGLESKAAKIYAAYLKNQADAEIQAAMDALAPPQAAATAPMAIPAPTGAAQQTLHSLLLLDAELKTLKALIEKTGGNLTQLKPELEIWQQGLAVNPELGQLTAAIGQFEPLRTAQLPHRFELGLSYFKTPLAELLDWLVKSKENTNFTYDLSAMNREHLAWFVVGVTGLPVAQVRQYLREIEEDEDLKQHVRRCTLASAESYQADEEARYGRRIGWYAFVRAIKPRVVVETGVDKGIGTCVLAAALMKNAAEGSPGLVYGLDINPQAGFLFKEPYSRYGRLLFGDSLATLNAFDQTIDLFIHDSNHDPVFERQEFETVQAKLAPEALILSDNAHVTAELYKYAEETGRQFLYFQEKPADHFYPGGSIGAAFFKPAAPQASAQQTAAAATGEQQYYDEGYFEWQKTIGRFGGRANLFKFADFVETDHNVVDFGCGGGFLLGNLNCRGKLGVELNPHARAEAARGGIQSVATIGEVPDAWADVIVSNHALEHVPDPLAILRPMLAKLKPGGRAVFVVPHQDHREEFNPDDQNHHLYTWNRQTLGNLFLKAGFEVEQVEMLQHMWPPDYMKLFDELGEEGFHAACRQHAAANANYQVRIVARRPGQALERDEKQTPVILIAYKRPQHTRQVLEALKRHGRTNLFIFSDAPRSAADRSAVEETRALIHAIDWCRPTVIEQSVNLGLARSIVSAADFVLERYDSFILLEDDCVPQEHFFEFMEDCLERYAENDKVFGVSGYSVQIPDEIRANYPYDLYFFPRIGSWGWATWKRAWQHREPDLTRAYVKAIEQGVDVCQGGDDVPHMLNEMIFGRLKDVWTLNWVLSVYLQDGYYIYPTESHIVNIGMDGTGEHCGTASGFDSPPATARPNSYPDDIVINEPIWRNFRAHYDLPPRPFKVTKAPGSPLKVVHLCSVDHGGAGKAAQRLNQELFNLGVDSSLIVLAKQSGEPSVKVLPSIFDRAVVCCSNVPGYQSAIWTASFTRWLAINEHYPTRPAGLELFSDVQTSIRLGQVKELIEADVINLHWVAGEFDYDELANIFPAKVLVWTLHDMNPFTGGCHYAGTCTRYYESCGACPQLGSNNGDDLSHLIWRVKQHAYASASLKVVSPSRWLADCASGSALLGKQDVRVIPNCLPLKLYQPYSKAEIRKSINAPLNSRIILFGADSLDNQRKGFRFLLEALGSGNIDFKNILLLCFGALDKDIHLPKGLQTISLGQVKDENQLAAIYAASDVFVLPSTEDNLPNTVVESLACGLPVVAFEIGGLPDLVDHLETGYLVRPGDVADLAVGIEWVLNNADDQMRRNCRAKAERMFAPAAQSYLKLYLESLDEVKQSEPARQALVAQGENLFAAGESATAAAVLERAAALYPASAEILNDLGAIHAPSDPELALRYFMQALKLEAQNRDALINLAELARALGRTETYAELFRQALAANSQDAELCELLSAALAQGGQD